MKTILSFVSVLALTGCAGSPEQGGDTNTNAPSGCASVSDASSSPWSCVPSGTSKDLNRVWGSGHKDVWAVGVGGTILHWDGSAWSGVASGTTLELRGLWGSGPEDVWAVGDQGMILHWDGTAWSADTSGAPRSSALRGLWGSGASDVWAVGDQGTILHFDGAAWSAVAGNSTPDLASVWGSRSADVWAVGVNCKSSTQAGTIGGFCSSNNIVHWDGSIWSGVSSGTFGRIADVWGSGPGDVWAVTIGTFVAPRIQHWDGASWSGVANSRTENVYGLWGSGPNDVWFGGGSVQHWNGAAWSSEWFGVSGGLNLRGVWGSGAADVWAVGSRGVILHH
jgi:hypothetical protein